MAISRRRPSVFPTDNELSMAQTDELLVYSSREEEETVDGMTMSSTDRTRRVWSLYLIGFMDLFGVSMMIPLLPKIAMNVGASRTVGGLIGSLYGALQVFSSPVMGKLSDTYGRKSILLLSYLGPCIGYFMMSASNSVLFLFLSRIPSGLLKHGLSISKGYLTDITEIEDRRSVLGMFNALSSLGFIFGPLISGHLAERDPSLKLSIGLGAIIFAINFVVVAFCLPDVKPQLEAGDKNRGGILSINLKSLLKSINIFSGIHWVELADLIFVRFSLTFAVIMFRTNFPVFLEEHFHAGSTILGRVLSLNGIIGTLSAATCGIISSYYTNRTKQVVHFSLLLALSLGCLTVSQDILFLVLFMIPMAMSTSNLRICLLTLMLERGQEDEKGAIIGIGNSVTSVARMLAPSIVGVGQEYGSEAIGYLSSGFAVLGVVILLLVPIKSNKTCSKKHSEIIK